MWGCNTFKKISSYYIIKKATVAIILQNIMLLSEQALLKAGQSAGLHQPVLELLLMKAKNFMLEEEVTKITLPFGKYKGALLLDVYDSDRNYLKYLSKWEKIQEFEDLFEGLKYLELVE
jgi:uncharacterized protein (DUF3820 family)